MDSRVYHVPRRPASRTILAVTLQYSVGPRRHAEVIGWGQIEP